MTLAEMAAYVCAKVRQQDTTAIARCKEFIRQRYELIYNDQLWKASLYLHEFQLPAVERDFDPNITTTGEEGMYFFPTAVDRIVALRRTAEALDVGDELMLFRGSLDEYDEEGSPIKFVVLSPALFWVASPDDSNMPLYFKATNAADVGQVLKVNWVDGAGYRHVNTEVTLALVNIELGDDTFEAGVQLIETVTKPTTEGRVEMNFDEGDTGNDIRVGLGAAAATSFETRQRIRVFPKPGNGASALGYRALVKRKVIALTQDGDTPQLFGIENCLMAFAQADLLQRARRYGQAQAVTAEGVELLDQFKRLESVQQANRTQFVPEVLEQSGNVGGWGLPKGYV